MSRTVWLTSPTRQAISRAGRVIWRAGCPATSGPPRSTVISPGIWPSSSWGAGGWARRCACTRTASRPAPRWRRRSTPSATPPPFSGAWVSMGRPSPPSAGRLPAGPGAAELAEGLGAFAVGDYEGAIRRIEPVAGEITRLGGSHAQRDVFEETLIQAYLRTDRREQAAALLRRRLDRRPSARDLDWLARAG